MDAARRAGTAKDSALACPHCHQSTPMTMLRGDPRTGEGTRYGLRMWDRTDVVPQQEDVFQERLYCIRWVDRWIDAEGKEQTERYYAAPDEQDLERDRRVLDLLTERFDEWQEKGFTPSRAIQPGNKTDELIRTRGWTHWHQLFTPRQLLMYGLHLEAAEKLAVGPLTRVPALLGIDRCADWSSKLSRWDSSAANEKVAQTFSNQALNTMVTYASKSLLSLDNSWFLRLAPALCADAARVYSRDARSIDFPCDVWVTDPPYADAINYHELSEYFLAWYEKHLPELFPDWYSDSRRALAITGSDETFRKSMVDCYRNLAKHMPDTGVQIVMFTHQDASVWADLALILWASGLRVTAAWCVATETDTALKVGNYVQGTVLLVLRKQTSEETAFLDEVYPRVENEVRVQLDAMLALEDQEDPNFGDTDYQLAAYAAALRVLTQYKNIEDVDVAYELTRTRARGEESPVEQIIADAVKTACDHLLPKGFDAFVWKTLTPEERFYLKGLDLESHGEYRAGAYQELARGFGVRKYRGLLADTRANETRLKTATELGARLLGDAGFGASATRHALFAVREIARTEEVADGRNWSHNEIKDTYWSLRKSLIEVLRYLGRMGLRVPVWKKDGAAAVLLAGALENDHPGGGAFGENK